ncbi:hypothetical protein CR513_57925, partial [Mucuna pruriens]
MSTLITVKFDGSPTMHEHVIEMTNIVARLKTLEITVNENFLVQFILNSLSTEYGLLQMSYNTIKDKWNIDKAYVQIQNKALKSKNCHFHKEYLRYKAWFEKKGKLNVYVCFKSNITKVPDHTW